VPKIAILLFLCNNTDIQRSLTKTGMLETERADTCVVRTCVYFESQ